MIASGDQIPGLEHVEIIERGTHRELIALGGRYRHLFNNPSTTEKDQYINPGEDFITVGPRDEIRKI